MSHNNNNICAQCAYNSISDYPKAIFNTVANRCTAAVTILLITKADKSITYSRQRKKRTERIL